MSDNNTEAWKKEKEVYLYKVLIFYVKRYNELEGRQ